MDELVKDHRITDATYAVLAERYTPQQLLDLVFTIGSYTLNVHDDEYVRQKLPH